MIFKRVIVLFALIAALQAVTTLALAAPSLSLAACCIIVFTSFSESKSSLWLVALLVCSMTSSLQASSVSCHCALEAALIEILLFNRCVCHLVHTVGQDKAPGVDSKYLCKHRPGTLLENT